MKRAETTSGLTRRHLLQSGATAAVALGLWPSFRASALAQSSVIQFMSWEGYDFPGPMEEWKKKNGVEIQSTYMGSHDDIQAKILGGGGAGLDLITYGSSYKELYRELKILKPIDESRIPNLKNLLPFFASNVHRRIRQGTH